MPDLSSTVLLALSLYIVSSVYLLAMAAQRARPPKNELDRPLFFVLVVPALNEELVIGNTVRHLLSLRGDNYLVMVIDDGSDDQTAAAVEAFQTPRVRLIQRRAPFARMGKGAALNFAYEAILTSELPELYGEENIVMAVMDADGQVEADMLEQVAPYFAAPKTGAVQTGVRMLNASQNVFTRWQQYEFVTFNWIFSRARDAAGSGSLGGNGQFVRLSALASLGNEPWSDNLTEDLDLGLRLMLKGWRNHYCHQTRVYQQAVVSFKRLVRQRSRWYQGHLSCWKHIPGILLHDMPAYRKADVLNYLLMPALVIPMGVISIIGVGSLLLGLLGVVPMVPMLGRSLPTGPAEWVEWYALGLGVAPLFAYAIWRDRQTSFLAALFWAHVFVLGSYIWFVAALIAVRRMLSGKVGWIKTARTPIDGAPEIGNIIESESRFLAARSGVRLADGSREILPLRIQNFVPGGDDGDEPSPAYEPPSSVMAHRPSEVMSLARAEAQLRRFQRHLEQKGVLVGQPHADGGALAETDDIQVAATGS